MINTLIVVLCLIIILALLMIVISGFTPKTAFFLKEKTRQKAILSWFGIGAAAFILICIVMPFSDKKQTVPATPAVPQAPSSGEPSGMSQKPQREAPTSGTPQQENPLWRPIDVDLDAFIVIYNKTARGLGGPLMPMTPTTTDNDTALTAKQFELSPTIGIAFHYIPKEKKPFEVFFVTTEHSKEGLLSAMSFINAMMPGMTPDARGKMAAQLGIVTGDFLDGKTRRWEGNGMRWTVDKNELAATRIHVEAQR